MLNNELNLYSDKLYYKKRIIVANKIDLCESEAHLKRFKKKYKQDILEISALKGINLKKLIAKIEEVLLSFNQK